MEVKITENSKDRMSFELIGEDHTLCNVLVKKLQESKDVKYAVYSIEHPLVSVPKLMIEAKDVKAALKKAISELSEQADELKKLAHNL
ncbi:MAG: DNA-directed RNA polymerase subunit L [Candidatus Woesearchaeota archaeon]|jgi:DNA-directed RNA polymerase subunit L